jgi:hypothetical protein
MMEMCFFSKMFFQMNTYFHYLLTLHGLKILLLISCRKIPSCLTKIIKKYYQAECLIFLGSRIPILYRENNFMMGLMEGTSLKKRISHKGLHIGYFWSTIFRYS